MKHIAGFLGSGVRVFEIHTAALGHALAASLGQDAVLLMRGHGSVGAAGDEPELRLVAGPADAAASYCQTIVF
jgi:hypothetical protein